VSDAVQVIGCVVATAAVSGAMLAQGRRPRAALMLLGLAIAFALLVGEAWDELSSLREPAPRFAALCSVAAAALATLALLLHRRPLALPLLLVAALPFRLPLEIGGEDANLLLPLYAVIGAGALAMGVEALRRGGARERPAEARPLLIVLALAIVLYAAQSAYSEDIPFATRNVTFFLVPFAAMFVLLTDVEWSPRVLGRAMAVVVASALLFAVVGIAQQIAGEIFWNPALELSNDFHFYFRVNSLFWDPNIYGRYLALAIVLITAVLLWTREPRRIAAIAALLALLLVAMLFGFSQTSFVSLLIGIAVLCALRYSALRTAIAVPFALVAVAAALIFIGGTSEAEDDAREISSGRTTLISGGLELARSRPVLGHGSASFSPAFAEQEGISTRKTTISHNEPVTVAAEQGVIGLLAYTALIVAAYWMLLTGMRRTAPGLGAPSGAVGDAADGGPGSVALARIGLVAAFSALVVHTVGYAGYLTDPLTWALLAIAASLAAGASTASR
jgi:O-antigen ligase